MKKLIFLLLLLASPLLATDRYVDPTPPGGCTNGAAYDPTGTGSCGSGSGIYHTSLNNAGDVAVAGDTVFMRAGTYPAGLSCSTVSCNSGTNWTTGAITFKPYNSEAVTINNQTDYYDRGISYHIWDGTNTLIADMNKATDRSCFNISTHTGQPQPHHIRVTNLTCRETDGDGVSLYQANFLEIINVTFIDNGDPTDAAGSHGIYITDVLGGTTIENSTFNDSACYGIQVYDYVRNSAGLIIRNNTFFNSPDNPNFTSGGIILGGPFGPSGALIYNNVFHSPLATVSGWAAIAVSRGSGNKILNNSILGNGSSVTGGIRLSAPASGTQVRNNLIYNTGTTYLFQNLGSNTTCSTNNFTATGCTFSTPYNPLYVSSTDLQLQTGSLAIGAGSTLTEFSTDFANVSRPQPVLGGWDVGAYEKISAAGESITLLVPNSNTPPISWQKTQSQTISWEALGGIVNVRIRADRGNDGTFEETVTGSPALNTGSLSWTPGGTANANVKIEVCDASDNTPCDISDNTFAITDAAGGSGTAIISNNTTGPYSGNISGVTDTYISQQAADTSYSGDGNLRANKHSAGTHTNTLIRFPLDQIPSAATVTNVCTGWYMGSGGTGTPSIDQHRLRRDWTAGATWNKYDGTNNWSTAGGLNTTTDIVATVSGTFSSLNTTLEFKEICDSSGQMKTDVQNWVNLTNPNYGWLRQRQGSGNDSVTRGFSSSDNSTNGNFPYLTVTYTTAAPSISILSPATGAHIFPGQTVPVRWSYQGVSNPVVITVARDGVDFTEQVGGTYAITSADVPWTVPDGKAASNVIVKVCSDGVCGTSTGIRISGKYRH